MKRILSGIGLMAAAVAIVGWAPRWVIFLALVIVSSLALAEFFDLCEKCGLRPPRMIGYVYALWLLGEQLIFPEHVSLAAFTLFILTVLTVSLGGAGHFSDAIGSSGATVLGTVYTAGFLSLLLAWPDPASDGAVFHHSPFQTRAAIFFVLAVIWAADTGAFYAGRTFGKKRLAPKVSPGKTVEGLIGGLGASLVVAVVFQHFWMKDYSRAGLLFLAAILNIAGVIGDLVESAMKRGAGVKDSSAIIPGHGGVLDRIDSLLFAIPVMYYYPSVIAFLKSLLKAF